MNLIELPRAPLQGELNVNRFVAGPGNTVLLQRLPKDNPQILRSIAHEYHEVGFTRSGGRFSRRSPREQTDFINFAASQGLRILPPILFDSGIAHFPFLVGAQTLDEYLPTAPDEGLEWVMYQLFTDLRRAHSLDIIYGDRWSRNILVTPLDDIVHIDFDIQISGEHAKEFEVAQAVYYTLCAGGVRSIPILVNILKSAPDWFDSSTVARFLQGHARHFHNDPKYGGVADETAILVEMVGRWFCAKTLYPPQGPILVDT